MKIQRPLWMDQSGATVGQLTARRSRQLLPRTYGGGPLLFNCRAVVGSGNQPDPAQNSLS